MARQRKVVDRHAITAFARNEFEQKRMERMQRYDTNVLYHGPTTPGQTIMGSAETRQRRTNHFGTYQKYMGLFLKISENQANSLRKQYLYQFKELRKRITCTKKQKSIAKTKALFVACTKEQCPIRMDGLGHIMTELGSASPFAGKEVLNWSPQSMLLEEKRQGYLSGNPTPKKQSPNAAAIDFSSSMGDKAARWEFSHYNAVMYFTPNAKNSPRPVGSDVPYRKLFGWETIKQNARGEVLAIQVMHPDPKVLLQTTKGMLKRRPNDPIAVFDVYGKPFFP